ncbi:hypothetical protein C8K36_1045 [Rhodococcus sp. OK519]|uniref:hypothetical protein n=1 Tax=Rhodococcus sp. OK519 TaxID=2135729 RepID=UPI000D34BE69|nr:hypothetical protein C8K36_1045 [Rhodococcus sp. OK519]
MSTPVPLPGQHLPGTGSSVDPASIHSRVDALLTRLDGAETDADTASGLTRQAQILERAHDVLVESLAAVDKV